MAAIYILLAVAVEIIIRGSKRRKRAGTKFFSQWINVFYALEHVSSEAKWASSKKRKGTLCVLNDYSVKIIQKTGTFLSNLVALT